MHSPTLETSVTPKMTILQATLEEQFDTTHFPFST